MKTPLRGQIAFTVQRGFFFLILCGSLLFATNASAATSVETIQGIARAGDFVLEPGKVEVAGDPGETIIRNIFITNRASDSVRFRIQTEDFIGSQDGNQTVVLLGNEKSPYSFKDNLVADVSEFSLKFGQRMTIPISIQIPTDAQPGGYYSTVLISNAPEKESNGIESGAKVISRLGALFFVRVNGEANEEGKLDDFRLKETPKLFHSKGPFNFQILFNNTGSVHLVPYGLITITNLAGKQVAQLPVNAYFSLPKSLRYREVPWNPSNLIGRYTATLELNRGYASTTDTMSFSFWVFPWKMVLTILIPILVLTFVLYIISLKFEFKRKE